MILDSCFREDFLSFILKCDLVPKKSGNRLISSKQTCQIILCWIYFLMPVKYYLPVTEILCLIFPLPHLSSLLCSGWKHLGSGDRPVPHTGRVRHMLLVWGELSPEGGPGALQRLYAATCLQSPEWGVLTRFTPCFYIMKKSEVCILVLGASQVLGHELHTSSIYGDMKKPSTRDRPQLMIHTHHVLLISPPPFSYRLAVMAC